MSETLTLVSGITCVIASIFILYILKIDFENKRHMLRMFQLGLFAVLLVIGVLQIMAVVTLHLSGDVPRFLDNILSFVYIGFCLLLIPYFRYYKRKHKVQPH